MESPNQDSRDQKKNKAVLTRRSVLGSLGVLGGLAAFHSICPSNVLGTNARASTNSRWEKSIEKGLTWLASQQSRIGSWPEKDYPVAISALAGIALICSGSTTTQGPYAKNIRSLVDFLMSKANKKGLIGDPKRDNLSLIHI